jgi:hypothetical protein
MAHDLDLLWLSAILTLEGLKCQQYTPTKKCKYPNKARLKTQSKESFFFVFGGQFSHHRDKKIGNSHFVSVNLMSSTLGE